MAEETITAQTPEIDPGMSVMPEGPGLMDVPTVIPELGLAAQALASQVSFAKKTWKDGSAGGTPITAAELNRLEQGVADLTNAVNGLRDSVSQSWQKKTITVTTSPNGNASVGLSAYSHALLAVVCPNGLSDNRGVICTPYMYSAAGHELGFHATSEQAPFNAVKSTELTVDVFYRKL